MAHSGVYVAQCSSHCWLCAQVEKAREAQVIGILIATLSTANFTDVAAKLRAMIAAAGTSLSLSSSARSVWWVDIATGCELCCVCE